MKRRARHKAFAERAANLSTRVSGRGYGFPDQWMHLPELTCSLEESLGELVLSAMAAAAVAMDPDATTDKRDAARSQVNRARGYVGNLLGRIGSPEYWDSAEAFMTIARLRLPEEVFEELMVETRGFREAHAHRLRGILEQFMDNISDAAKWRPGEVGAA